MLEVIVFLVYWLGMVSVKWELEDLFFVILYFKKYEEIVWLVVGCVLFWDIYLVKVCVEIVNMLIVLKIKVMVEGCFKYYWLIY